MGILCQFYEAREKVKSIHDEGVCQKRTRTLHTSRKGFELRGDEDVRQLGELTEDVRIRRDILAVERNPKSSEDHDVRQQVNDVVQRLLTAFDEDRLGDGGSPIRWLMQHLFEFVVCRRVLKLIELVAISRRYEQG